MFCPKHPARAGRAIGQLSINLKTDEFRCWSCPFRGRDLIPLLRLKGNCEELQEYLEERRTQPKERKPERTYATPVLPPEFRTLSEAHRSPYYRQAMAYLDGRGVTADDILLWRLGYCETGEYRGRIIFPSFDSVGELNFFTGRTFYDDPRRYKHGNFCKDIIWNECAVDWTRPVVVTEGPFDAIRAGENAVPLQGVAMSERSVLFKKIVYSGVDPYFALDSDAFKRQLSLMDVFLQYGVTPHHIDLGGRKDVAEMTRDEFREAFRAAVPIHDKLDLARLRLTA